MGSTPIAQLSQSLQTEQDMNHKPENRDYEYAVNLVHSICCLAGVPSYLDALRADLRDNGVVAAVNDHNTARLFDWLMSILSFQGIANRVAEDFIHRHGNVGWSDIEQTLALSPSCPKLGGYWLFNDCRYHKTSGTCTEPDHFAACPLPRHPLRNGHLNQMAYSLALFIRDIAGGDLVHWIDQQLAAVDAKSAMNVAAARDALIGPLRNVYGVSDKVLALAFSVLLMGESAVWRYCAEGELDICNGNRIHDAYCCDNVYCRLHMGCDRIALKPKKAEKAQKIA
jgi:hypothetical protein